MGVRDDAIQFNTKAWFKNIRYNTADFYGGAKKEPKFKGSLLFPGESQNFSCLETLR